MKITSFLILVFAFISQTVIAQQITEGDAIQVAEKFLLLNERTEEFLSLKTQKLAYTDTKLDIVHLIEFQPKGFIVISSSKKMPPVLAYSFDNNFGLVSDENPLFKLLITESILRFENLERIPDFTKNWHFFLSKEIETKQRSIQYWPLPGTTGTGGWLEDNWTQNAPYNNFCPMDPVTGVRSYAGCPSVAMAMILNYHKIINGTTFNDDDDYYHNFGSGRQYWIDDDHEDHDFPSFPELNLYLDTLVSNYEQEKPLTNNDKAALTFACGVACTQVYSSSGSGTFGVSQANDAYGKFNCDKELITSDTEELYTRMAQNMQIGIPAHLAVVNESWTSGHNLVVDGYNSTGYFHLNFGWGGTNNAWYLVPEGIPYDLTVLEGVIIDIMYPENASPILYDIETEGIEDSVLSFLPVLFENNYFDLENDELAFIRILSLPEHGTLMLGENEIETGQEILPEELDQFMFLSEENWNGTTEFLYSACDGFNMAKCAAKFFITLTPVNDPPVFMLSDNLELDQDFNETSIISITPNVPSDETNQEVEYTLLPDSLSFIDMVIDSENIEIQFNSIPDEYGTGEVTVTATEINETEDNVYSQFFLITVNQSSSISLERVDKKIILYPNPANQYLKIEGIETENETFDFFIYDQEGKSICIAKKNHVKPINYIDVSDFKQGVYYILIDNNGIKHSQKILILR